MHKKRGYGYQKKGVRLLKKKGTTIKKGDMQSGSLYLLTIYIAILSTFSKVIRFFDLPILYLTIFIFTYFTYFIILILIKFLFT